MRPLVRTVSIKNYKSIANCRVDLGPLMFLVGPNGAGKSNFLDALRFVADALNTTLEQSLRDRVAFSRCVGGRGGIPPTSAFAWI